ncbi:DUF427 domain-containing protein [Kribbella catacumbae]|uniref:DUF427 domain-containing protein n=1 Tax=Kribbella catacumbae TaxID=460086 RepID=UPI000477A653|nr:DUF427 domain-containing protein [Kribbella catacumbae]
MSKRMGDLWASGLGLLRHEPTEMRLRAISGGRELVNTTRAVLVWEPRRVVASYAVPVAELGAELTVSSVEPVPAPEGILHPGHPFLAHSCPGQVVDVDGLAGAGFRPDDPELAEYVVLDFKALDEWYEEDERLVSHPRDPYHRVVVRASSRSVRVERDGVLLAESSRPSLVFETTLPTRFYLPREDVVAELLPSERHTACAYKGHATYYSVEGAPNLFWSYLEPQKEVRELAGLVSFFDDDVDVYVDGELRDRPSGPHAESVRQEFSVS